MPYAVTDDGVKLYYEETGSGTPVMPNCGHGINVEEPDEFNAIVGDFLAQVDSGRWPSRDPRAVTASITGMR
ncbi:MAG: alpha/beta hydrolase [Syntrophales bacterium]|nr:alpha/beta hydrolase [Syntrophales bacterium]